MVAVTAGETFASAFTAVYLDTTDSGKAKKAQADGTAAEADAIGILLSATADDAAGVVQVSGPVTNPSWTWTPGAALFVSATAGALTETAPVTVGHYVKPFGYAISATQIIVDPDTGWVVGSAGDAGGANTYVQINDGGALSGESNFTFDKTTETLALSGPGIFSLTGVATGNIVTLTDAATISVDMSAGMNFTVTTTTDRAMGNPSNATAGQSGLFIIKGGDTVTWGNQYYFPGGTAPDTTSGITLVPYFCESSSVIYCGAGLEGMAITS